jgi:hypothetical protein
MAQNSVNSWKNFNETVGDERDSKKISDLIEQLDRDLAQTEKKASRRR